MSSKDLSGLSYQEIKELVDWNWPWPLDAIQEWMERFHENVEEWTYDHAKAAIDYVLRYASSVWETLKVKVSDVIADFFETTRRYWTTMRAWVDDALEGFFARAWAFWDSMKARVNDALESFFDTAWRFWDKVKDTTEWIGVKFVEIRDFIVTKMEEAWEDWQPRFEYWAGQFLGIWDKMTPWFNFKFKETEEGVVSKIEEGYEWSTGKFDEVKGFITENITDPLRDFFEGWIEAIKAAIRGALDAAWGVFWSAWETMITFFKEQVLTRVIGAFKWLANMFLEVIDAFWDTIKGWLGAHSPITPEDAVPSALGLMGILGISAMGLGMMTVGGEIMHPLKEMGMGHIAAMIGDVVNFRTISGVIVGALVGGGIKTPLTYYINKLLRPWLPDKRQIMEMRGRALIERPVFDPLMAYQGYGDQWMDLLDRLTETRVGYFALRAIADSGYFDYDIFKNDLHRASYGPDIIEPLLSMYESMALGEAKPMFATTAIAGFKEGQYGEADLREFLISLGYRGVLLERIIFASQLAYELDYKSDLLAGYREAFRKDQITESEFRGSLAEIIVIPERIQGYVFRDTVKKVGKVPVIKPPPAYYETVEGKIRVNTAKRLWRAGVIDNRELVSTLTDYEMPLSMAEAVLDEEEAMKLPTRVPAPPPLRYETATGKVELSTVKDQYYKEVIDRSTALAQMLELEVPRELAEAMLENIETRRIKRPK